MKNKKKSKITSLLTILLAVLGVCLLIVGGIGGVRAVLSRDSGDNIAEMGMPTVAAVLKENGTEVEGEDKLLNNVSLTIGKPIPEVLTVTNTGSADIFTRVTIYKYWKDSEGKRVDLDPALIQLTFGSGWEIDPDATTAERTVLYYTTALKAGTQPAATSKPVVTKVTASSNVANLVEEETETKTEGTKTYTTITSVYQYDGLNLCLEVSVDAIQTHNAQEAIKASWGVDVTANETTLSLGKD